MGLFLVARAQRGRGLGTQLWFARRDRLLARLGPEATIGLDGVDAMVPFYQRGGFQAFARHRRFELVEPPAAQPQCNQVVVASSVSLPALADYDRRCFPARRESFLAAWMAQPGAAARAFVEDGRLLGFGVIRPCLAGWKIGPLFADSAPIATALMHELRRASAAQQVYLDVPDNNPAALALCRKHNMTEVFGCVRMYYGPPPALDQARIFGVTTLEIG